MTAEKNTAPGHPALPPPGFRSLFNRITGFASKNKLQTGAILGAVLLTTTGLATPLLGATMTAGALMAGAFLLLAKSSDAMIDHCAAIGRKMKLSPLLIGLGLGALTSMPELFVSLGAIAKGLPELGIGNIVGSNIANTLFILGATAAISPLAKGEGIGWKFNNIAMLGATAMFSIPLMTGALTPVMGAAMLGLGAAYMGASYYTSKRDMQSAAAESPAAATEEQDHHHPEKMPGWFNATWAIAGLGGLVCAADLLVNSASRFALGMGVSQALVGALAVAVGTSLPELVVNIKTALKKETDMALGNILGSNIFNILAVGGAVALASTAVPAGFSPSTPQGLLNFAGFGASAALLGAALYKNGGGLKRWQGIAGIGLYAAFVAASMALDTGATPAAAPAPPAAVQLIEQNATPLQALPPPPAPATVPAPPAP